MPLRQETKENVAGAWGGVGVEYVGCLVVFNVSCVELLKDCLWSYQTGSRTGVP